MDYTEWFEQLKKVAEEKYGFTKAGIRGMRPDDWKEYFDDGMTPEEGLLEGCDG